MKVSSLSGATAIWSSASANHACATTATDVRCWGAGWDGRLGNGGTSTSNVPVVVVGLTDPAEIAVGGYFTCALRKAGTVACWGNNYWRSLPLGDASPPSRVSSPVDAVGLTIVQRVAAGSKHGCAIHDGGRISCWGRNVGGALGRGNALYAAEPTKVSTQATFTHVSAGEDHTCAVTSTGTLLCWGNNDADQVSPKALPVTATPTDVPSLGGVTLVAAGQNHTCALSGTTLSCYGYNYFGALGNGTQTSSPTPVTFQAGGAVTHAEGGYSTTCAVRMNGQIACAGYNADQQVSQPSSTRVTTPATVLLPGGDAGATPLGGVVRAANGSKHTCALTGSAVYCWGANGSGQTGASGGATRPPTAVTLPGVPVGLTAGSEHTCALLQNGTVRCWGNNVHGQLGAPGGSGATLRQPTFTQSVKAITAGDVHNCAVLADDTVACWGAGGWGELGNGLRSDSATPVAVKNLGPVKAIAADNSEHVCAIKTDGSLWCWGRNTWGQLGDASPMITGTPAPVVGY